MPLWLFWLLCFPRRWHQRRQLYNYFSTSHYHAASFYLLRLFIYILAASREASSASRAAITKLPQYAFHFYADVYISKFIYAAELIAIEYYDYYYLDRLWERHRTWVNIIACHSAYYSDEFISWASDSSLPYGQKDISLYEVVRCDGWLKLGKWLFILV